MASPTRDQSRGKLILRKEYDFSSGIRGKYFKDYSAMGDWKKIDVCLECKFESSSQIKRGVCPKCGSEKISYKIGRAVIYKNPNWKWYKFFTPKYLKKKEYRRLKNER